ncbi:MAG: terminase TerL endonuclease subunit [Pseudomonadota bacterium]
MLADFSCPDWREKLAAGLPPLPDNLPIDEAEANLAVRAFDQLRLPDVVGQPRLADVAGDWQREFVRAVFGLVVMDDKREVIIRRHANKFFKLVPKKNSKTTGGAAIMLVALLRNRRPNAEFLLVGPTQVTADLAYSQAEGMINADRYLKSRFNCVSNTKQIVDLTNGAKLRIKSFDNKVMTGAKPVGVLVDELHEIGKIGAARKIMAQIDGGILANPEGFIIVITTQSDSPPTGVFRDDLKYARAVRDGEIKGGELLPMLYEFDAAFQRDPARPWADPSTWAQVLPNLGRSITIDRLLPKFREAQEKGAEALAIWASQHLNIEIGVGLTTDGWAGAEYWQRGAYNKLTLPMLMERSDVCVIGVDGGGLDDLYGVGVLGRDKETRDWLHWGHALISQEGLQRRKANAAVYEGFIEDGDLTVVDGLPDDLEFIVNVTRMVKDANLLGGFGVDPAGYGGIVEALAEIDVTEDNGLLCGIRQGIGLMGASKAIERKLVDGSFKHGGSRLMAWCAGNAKVKQTSTAVMIERAASGFGKIDPLMALFNAAALMAKNPDVGSTVSVYEERGLLMV